MRILIAEDDAVSRIFLEKVLSEYGDCDLVVDGLETMDAYLIAMREKNPYDLICLDIMMPKIDGVKVLKAIRNMEIQKGIIPGKRAKIIIVTALGETKLVLSAYEYGCEAYISKPIDITKLVQTLETLGLISQ